MYRGYCERSIDQHISRHTFFETKTCLNCKKQSSEKFKWKNKILLGPTCTISKKAKRKWASTSAAVPDYCVCADNKLRPWVPLVVGDVVMRLKPDPLLTFSQETVVARLSFAVLHHWTGRERMQTIAEMLKSTSGEMLLWKTNRGESL